MNEQSLAKSDLKTFYYKVAEDFGRFGKTEKNVPFVGKRSFMSHSVRHINCAVRQTIAQNALAVVYRVV